MHNILRGLVVEKVDHQTSNFWLYNKLLFMLQQYHHWSLTPCRALSSLYVLATSLNFCPSLSFPRASIALECFSQRICLTFTAVPAPDFFPLPPPPPLAESELSAPWGVLQAQDRIMQVNFWQAASSVEPEMLQQRTSLSSFALPSSTSFASTPSSTLSLWHFGAIYLE